LETFGKAVCFSLISRHHRPDIIFCAVDAFQGKFIRQQTFDVGREKWG
jgi:hypothetical protein